MSSRFLPAISRGWLAEELYGWRAAPTIAACRVPYLYAKAMLLAGGGASGVSGMLSAHFAGGMDADLLNFVRHFEAPTAGLTLAADIATASARAGALAPTNARVVVYDAMSAAGGAASSADSAAADVAEGLGVSGAATERIAALCRREAAMEARRHRLMLGDETSAIA